MICGGHSGAKPADDNIQSIANNFRGELEGTLNTQFSEYVAESYTTQVVAGTNYTITVNIGGGKKIQLKVFQALPCNGGELQLTNHQLL